VSKSGILFGVALLTCVTSIASAGRVAYFPLDSDGNSANGNTVFTAALNENVTYGEAGANANTGTSALFNGTDSRIQHAWNTLLNPTSFTLTLWAKSNGGQGAWNSPVTSRQDLNPNSEGYLIYDNNPNGVWTFWSGNGTDAGNWQTLDGPAVDLGSWEHIAITYDDNIKQKALYVNGVLEVTQDTSLAPNTATPFNIGAGGDLGDSFRFNGNIDDIGLWDEVLPLATIQKVMNDGVASVPEPSTFVLLGMAAVGLILWRRK